MIVPYESHGLLGVSHMKSVAPLVGFGVELLTSLVVMLTVLTCTDGGERALDTSASLVIGAAVTACHLFAVIVMTIIIDIMHLLQKQIKIYCMTQHRLKQGLPVKCIVIPLVIFCLFS